ncbi:MAG: PAS domain-containing protein, partial [Burkholderiales bacterium]|nr:PAS domain-containing protein [Burkholderiales bacterium]
MSQGDLYAAALACLALGAAGGYWFAARRAGTRAADERRMRDIELERFAEQLAAAYAASPVAIFLTAEDGRITEANDTAVAMTGYSRAELLARSIQQLGFWRGQPESYEQLVVRLLKGRVLHRLAAFERRDGARRDAELSITLI